MPQISFDELLAKREQRERDKHRAKEIPIPGSDKTLLLQKPGYIALMQMIDALNSAEDTAGAVDAARQALYHCCPALQDQALQEQLDTKADPLSSVDALFDPIEINLMGQAALQFVGLLPSDDSDSTGKN